MNRVRPKYLWGILLLVLWGPWGYGIQPVFARWANPQFIVETDWLGKNLGKANLVIIHIAPKRDMYSRGHIPGAIFIPYGTILKQVGESHFEVPPVEEMAHILQSAGVNRDSMVIIGYETTPWVRTLADATRLFWNLEYLGHDKVAILNGGLEKWHQERRPTTADPPTPQKGNFHPQRIHSQILIDMAGMKERIGKKDALILDTRNDLEYFGLSLRPPEPARRGHIPGAKLFP